MNDIIRLGLAFFGHHDGSGIDDGDYDDSNDYDDLDVDDNDIEELEDNASGIDRHNPSFEGHDHSKKWCPTRHGCTGATNCDYAYGDYPG